MKYVALLIIVCGLVACGDSVDNTDTSMKTAESANSDMALENKDPQLETQKQVQEITPEHTQEQKQELAPNFTDYQGVCPEPWGIVKGATKAHVDKFVQNYFFVPENSGAMYSDINDFPQPDGSTLLKAGTYKMQDSIVDQEMVALFSAGSMTQCGFRLRCASDPGVWVSSCDS